MQIVRAARECFAIEPNLAPLGHAIVIPVGEFPDVRRGGHIDRSFVPQAAFREHQPVGEDRAGVEDAVAIRVFQPQHTMRLFLQLLRHRLVGTGGFRDIEPPLVIEIRLHRSFHEQRTGRDFQRVIVGKGESAVAQHPLRGEGGATRHDQRQENGAFLERGGGPPFFSILACRRVSPAWQEHAFVPGKPPLPAPRGKPLSRRKAEASLRTPEGLG